MLMPTVFHENLFDDFFDPFWNDAALERMMNREARDTFGKRGANMMKTDVKQTDNGYEVDVDLPGCKTEDVQMDLNDGYLTIQAVRSHSNDEKDNKGRYVRRETFSGSRGSCARRTAKIYSPATAFMHRPAQLCPPKRLTSSAPMHAMQNTAAAR